MSKLLEQINNVTRETKKLGEVFEIIDGDRGANYPSKSEFTKSGYCIFLNTKNVPSQGFDFSNVDYISKERDELLRKGKLTRNDIVMTTRGTIGNIALYAEDMPFDCVRINSGMVVLRAKSEYDRTYLYTLIKSDIFNAQLKNTSSGSAQPQLPIRDLREIEIEIPDLPTQKKIAEILSAYDAKIENNTKIIKNLEAIAQAIFNEWFVNFRFPGYEKAKMVESEMGEIPDGWEVKTFKDSEIFSGCKDRIGKFEGKKLYFDTSCIDGIEIVKDPLIVSQDNIPSRAQFIPAYNSVWFARMSNTYKVLVFDKFSDFEVNNYLLSSGMMGIKTEEKYLGFLFAVIKSKVFHTQKDSGATGSTQVSLTDDGFSSIRILFPSLSLIQKYSGIVNRYISHIINLQKENIKLKKSRDQLLTKLI